MQSAHYTDITLIKRKAVLADRFVQDVECRGEFSASAETKTPTAALSVSDTTQAGNLKRVDVTWNCSVFFAVNAVNVIFRRVLLKCGAGKYIA